MLNANLMALAKMKNLHYYKEKNMSVKWCFPSTGGGQESGLNNGGLEQFRNNPIKSLTREICQNSLDAVLKNKTVIVEFSTFNIDTKDFPNVEEFKSILEKCKVQAKIDNDQKTEDFFDNALLQINNLTLSMLRISDFNTTGLLSSDWEKLVNKAGSSSKADGKLGSFGLGKNATFNCSNFRTVFYSTLTETYERSKGVSVLMSFPLGKSDNGYEEISQGVGFWGDVGEGRIMHLSNMLALDKNFHRDKTGTDIYVTSLNIDNKQEFRNKIISEVLDSFLIAVWNNKLEVVVDGEIISKKTLADIFKKYENILSQNTIFDYELLTDDDLQWYLLPVKISSKLPLGNIKLGFKIKADGTNKIAMIRSSGMKILDKSNLCKTLRYVGIGIVDGTLLDKFLRDLESPEHDKWTIDRATDKKEARAILKEIDNSIIKKLNEVAASLFDEQIDIEGAGDYLPDTVEEGKNPIQQVAQDFDKIITVETKIIKKPRTVAHLETDELGNDIIDFGDNECSAIEGEDFEGFRHHGHKKHTKGEKELEKVTLGDGEYKLKEFVLVKAKDLRVICINKEKCLYRVSFVSSESSSKGYIEIDKIAEQNDKMPIEIISVNGENLVVDENKIKYFELVNGKRVNIEFEIKDKEYLAMEVKIYAYKV